MSGFVTRFAPSPTGYLHRGHAVSALTAFEAAREAGGRFLLRIEDIDTVRCRPEFEAAIHEDLAWLGLEWERPVRRQSEHLGDYRAALDRLRGAGLVYRCFRTRKEVLDDIGRAPHGPTPVFRGGPLDPDDEAKRLANGEPFAWRLSLDAARKALPLDGGGLGGGALAVSGGRTQMDSSAQRSSSPQHQLPTPTQPSPVEGEGLYFVEDGIGPICAQPERLGDVVLARKDVGVAYHLAVVVDDAQQGVTHVIRGADLFEATHIQRLLQALLNLPTPTYRHHPLLLGPDGKRFAKRDGAQTLRELRASGVTAQDLRAELGFA